jgi:hypothetical protein
MGLFACALIIGAASFAMAGVPDLQWSTAARAYAGPETLSLFNVPNGSGKAFTQAFLPAGAGNADATISLTLKDGLGVPIDNYPFEDMWIESNDGVGPGLTACAGNAVADFNTNASGNTVWAAAMTAGGYSTALTFVMINGDALTSNAGIGLNFNSPDINADGAVNLSDGGFFSTDLFVGPYNYRSDFNNDGALNLTDGGFLASAIGATCP